MGEDLPITQHCTQKQGGIKEIDYWEISFHTSDWKEILPRLPNRGSDTFAGKYFKERWDKQMETKAVQGEQVGRWTQTKM